MSDDRLTDALGLGLRSTESLQLLQRFESTVPLERHVRVLAVRICASDVVVQASQSPGLEEFATDGTCDPFREVLSDDGVAVAVDAQAVEVGLCREDLFDVLLCLLDDICFGPDRVEVDGYGRCFGFCFGGDVGSVAWDGGPAEFFDLGLGHVAL